jgi:hypothetical protein
MKGFFANWIGLWPWGVALPAGLCGLIVVSTLPESRPVKLVDSAPYLDVITFLDHHYIVLFNPDGRTWKPEGPFLHAPACPCHLTPEQP